MFASQRWESGSLTTPHFSTVSCKGNSSKFIVFHHDFKSLPTVFDPKPSKAIYCYYYQSKNMFQDAPCFACFWFWLMTRPNSYPLPSPTTVNMSITMSESVAQQGKVDYKSKKNKYIHEFEGNTWRSCWAKSATFCNWVIGVQSLWGVFCCYQKLQLGLPTFWVLLNRPAETPRQSRSASGCWTWTGTECSISLGA